MSDKQQEILEVLKNKYEELLASGIIDEKLVFQAEDGIRDCLLSRGLGDVYKRQAFI